MPDVLAPPGRWRIEWQGRTWSEDDLTGAHLALVALLNGVDDWATLDVANLDPRIGPVRLMNLLAAFIAVDAGIVMANPSALAEVIRSVGDAPAEELLAAVRFD